MAICASERADYQRHPTQPGRMRHVDVISAGSIVIVYDGGGA